MQASEEYRNQTSSFGNDDPPLPVGAGYGMIVAFGLFFSVFCAFSTHLHLKYNKIKLTSEYFTTAGRDIGVGLISCAVLSSWTWSATILQSAAMAWKYGISGALWYAAGASIQIFLFGIMSFHLKKYASNAHTIGEIIYARWGPSTHKVFVYFLLLTNLLVVSMLIGGGSYAFQVITGLDKDVSSFFLRLFFFTGSGGLIATYTSAYVHTVIVNVIMVVFMFEILFGDNVLGSIDGIFQRLNDVAAQSTQDCIDFGYDPSTQTCGGVDGNYGGSYLTMRSRGGLFFGIINIVGNFGAVFMDQTYWQIAISSRNDTCHTGFVIGGLLWFAVPFCMALCLGLANVALQLPTNSSECNDGLVALATAVTLKGNVGGCLLLIQLFMAVSSAGSAEMNAIASILVYDIYRTYLNPNANSEHIKYYSRLCILAASSLMGALSVLISSLQLGLGWLYLVMGILIGSAVFPTCCSLTWRKASATAAATAALGGQVSLLSPLLFPSHLHHILLLIYPSLAVATLFFLLSSTRFSYFLLSF